MCPPTAGRGNTEHGRADHGAPADPALSAEQRAMIARLRRIEGQLRGIQNMIAGDAGCEAVAQQVAAARRALDRAFYELVACAMASELERAGSLDNAKTACTHVTRILAKYG